MLAGGDQKRDFSPDLLNDWKTHFSYYELLMILLLRIPTCKAGQLGRVNCTVGPDDTVPSFCCLAHIGFSQRPEV